LIRIFLQIRNKFNIISDMKIRNYEFKARAADLKGLEREFLKLNPVFRGEDHQVDIYFKVDSGRLKLREGNIENSLIYYERPDTPGAKESDVLLYRHNRNDSLKEILTRISGIKVIVDKRRRIYFIGNVKFHFDTVRYLGDFIEVEAIDETGQIPTEDLMGQCSYYFKYLGLKESDYIDKSYSDLVRERTEDINK
jgi:predicted adenylyl cyclase CyaB